MPNPFGKHPLASAVKKYLYATEQYYAPITQAERRRKIRLIGEQMIALSAPQSPQKWNKEHVRAFIKWMNNRDIQNATQRKYLALLRDFMEFYGNNIFREMIAKKEIRIPQVPEKILTSLSREEIEIIHNATLTMTGWTGSVSRLITMLYPYSGLRPSELRTLKYTDVDTKNWVITVSHPKGEKSNGKKRLVAILPHVREDVIQYLRERQLYLQKHGLPETVEPLIPTVRNAKVYYWSDAKLRKVKGKIQRLAGIEFKLKDYRSSFCQIAIDLGAELSAVSKMMGHKTTKTTETYYGRIRDISAIKEIERAFSEPTQKV